MSFFSLLTLITSILLARVFAICESYGVDFQDKGTYFQNASSTEPFTFVQYFEGCQNDISTNIFIDPNGAEYQCTNTSMTPNDTNEMSTCPITKDHLYSGAWSIIIASNNGDAAPIAFERDFSLVVGVPTTITVFPTVIVISTSTPYRTRNITSTATAINTSTRTITSPLVTITTTTTVTPSVFTSTVTSITSTVTDIEITAQPLITVITYTKTCSLAPSQTSPDPTASVTPSLLAKRDAQPTAEVELLVRQADLDGIRRDREAWLKSRRKRLEAAHRVECRGLDSASITVTETDPAKFGTSTSTVKANTTLRTTSTATTISYLTTRITATVLIGTTTLKQSTVTAPIPTTTTTASSATTITTTITQNPLVTITITTAPAESASACVSAGGKLV